MLTSINPATGEIIANYQEHSAGEINSIIESTAMSQRTWAAENIANRSVMMEKGCKHPKKAQGGVCLADYL